MILSLVLLNLAGGVCVDNLKMLKADEGFCRILRQTEMHGLKRKVRRVLERRWRKEKKRSVPSPSAAFRYLAEFHDARQEELRTQSKVKSFIPAPNEHLQGLRKLNRDMLGRVERRKTPDNGDSGYGRHSSGNDEAVSLLLL